MDMDIAFSGLEGMALQADLRRLNGELLEEAKKNPKQAASGFAFVPFKSDSYSSETKHAYVMAALDSEAFRLCAAVEPDTLGRKLGDLIISIEEDPSLRKECLDKLKTSSVLSIIAGGPVETPPSILGNRMSLFNQLRENGVGKAEMQALPAFLALCDVMPISALDCLSGYRKDKAPLSLPVMEAVINSEGLIPLAEKEPRDLFRLRETLASSLNQLSGQEKKTACYALLESPLAKAAGKLPGFGSLLIEVATKVLPSEDTGDFLKAAIHSEAFVSAAQTSAENGQTLLKDALYGISATVPDEAKQKTLAADLFNTKAFAVLAADTQAVAALQQEAKRMVPGFQNV